MSKCPKCGSSSLVLLAVIRSDLRNQYRCGDCGCDFMDPPETVFDRITTSPEVLAERFVYKLRCMGVNRSSYICWKSTIIYDAVFSTREEAFAATVEKLKGQIK